jgi:hypothetical protein
VRVGLDADGLEPDAVDARAAAGGNEQLVAAQLAAVAELQYIVLRFAPRGGRLDAAQHLDTVVVERVGERVAERSRLAAEQVLAAVDKRHLAAEAMDGLRHLDADRPAAEHEQAARDGLEAGRLAVGPDAVELAQAGDGRNERLGPGRHDNVLGGVARAIDLDDAQPGEPAAASQ